MISSIDPITEADAVPTCQHATGYIRGGSGGDADPAAFGRLLNFIADKGVSIWFDASGMYWKANEEDVDAEFLRLLRRFRESLHQAYGPDRLPAEEPGKSSRWEMHRRRAETEEAPGTAPATGAVKIEPGDRLPQIELHVDPAIGEGIVY